MRVAHVAGRLAALSQDGAVDVERAGNVSEYDTDLDCIVDDALWKPQVWSGMRSLSNWGTPPPASLLAPEDLAALMTGAHQAP
jgi:hypothetical protein